MHGLFQLSGFFYQLAILAALFIVTGAIDRDVPSVTLPWGTSQAETVEYRSDNILVFRNIRYGKAPTGELRFQRSVPPDAVISPEMTIMNTQYGPSCHQADISESHHCPVLVPTNTHNEDCLFLDIHVPQSVWDNRENRRVPVVVWFHGGAYEFGAKSAFGHHMPFYDGHGVLNQATNAREKFIFVSFNYRLGAFGWLAGSMMEEYGGTNAGFYDQRLVLEFVRDHIDKYGGDRDEVSAWGESAGGGSILHHLIAERGQRNPLFKRALVQSPAFQWQWDRAPGGQLDRVAKYVGEYAGCPDNAHGQELFQCLVDRPVEDLVRANQQLWNRNARVGLFPLGPALDRDTFAELSAVAFNEGRAWRGLDSLMISHVSHEPDSFLPKWVQDEDLFVLFVNAFMNENELRNVRRSILEKYSRDNYNRDITERLRGIIGDSCFYCNVRDVFNFYYYQTDIPVYMFKYDMFWNLAKHASDLLPTFWTNDFDAGDFVARYICKAKKFGVHHAYTKVVGSFAPHFQKYLANFAVSGNPTMSRKQDQWMPATVSDDDETVNVWEGGIGIRHWFGVVADSQTKQSTCSFWLDKAREVMAIHHASLADTPSVHANISDHSAQQPMFHLDLKRRTRRNEE